LTGSTINDTLSVLEDDAETEVALEAIKVARADQRMVRLRQNILDAIRACVEVLGHDAGIGQVGMKCVMRTNADGYCAGPERTR
jgi:hypothetical protein